MRRRCSISVCTLSIRWAKKGDRSHHEDLARGVREGGLDCSIVPKMQSPAAMHPAHVLLRILYSRKLLAME